MKVEGRPVNSIIDHTLKQTLVDKPNAKSLRVHVKCCNRPNLHTKHDVRAPGNRPNVPVGYQGRPFVDVSKSRNDRNLFLHRRHFHFLLFVRVAYKHLQRLHHFKGQTTVIRLSCMEKTSGWLVTRPHPRVLRMAPWVTPR